MLRLLKQTVSPQLRLDECIQDWLNISMLLRERSRSRRLQVELAAANFGPCNDLLS